MTFACPVCRYDELEEDPRPASGDIVSIDLPLVNAYRSLQLTNASSAGTCLELRRGLLRGACYPRDLQVKNGHFQR
jgi:hypothetical protein